MKSPSKACLTDKILVVWVNIFQSLLPEMHVKEYMWCKISWHWHSVNWMDPNEFGPYLDAR